MSGLLSEDFCPERELSWHVSYVLVQGLCTGVCVCEHMNDLEHSGDKGLRGLLGPVVSRSRTLLTVSWRNPGPGS